MSIIDTMNRLREDKKTLKSYYYNGSKFFKALEKYIFGKNKPIVEAPLDEEGKPMVFKYHRGSSPMRFIDAWTYGMQYDKAQPYESDVFAIEFSIDFCSVDEYRDYPDIVTKSYILRVPLVLETDFNEIDFKEWTMKLSEELYQSKLKKDLLILEKMIKSYPAEAKEMLRKRMIL